MTPLYKSLKWSGHKVADLWWRRNVDRLTFQQIGGENDLTRNRIRQILLKFERQVREEARIQGDEQGQQWRKP